MSSLVVEVSKIDRVDPHNNADALELAQIKGWQCVVPKDRYKTGDLVTYIPVDAFVPVHFTDRWGITKYCSVKFAYECPDGQVRDMARVRCAKLRGEPSFGVIVDVENNEWTEGTDVATYYDILKWVPEIKTTAGDAERPHGLFSQYTDVENLRNYPHILHPDEIVVATEKIHGTNCRIGVVEGEIMAGSMEIRRKRPETLEGNVYWSPLLIPGVQEFLEKAKDQYKQVILFGEVFGSKIQNLHYGMKGKLGFRAFDLLIDGKYLDYQDFSDVCASFDIPQVPLLYFGKYDLEKIKEVSKGQTTLVQGDSHIREGVVVKPAAERTDPRLGRVCLKYINDNYLLKAVEGKISDSQDV